MQSRRVLTLTGEAPPVRLQVASAYFGLGGLAITGSSLYHLFRLAAASASVGTSAPRMNWALVLALVTGACWLYTAWCLHQRKRRGAWSAAFALIATLATHGLPTLWDALFPLAALVLFASVWRELER